MLPDMRWSWTTASLAFKEIIRRALEGFYINSRSWHLFSRPSVKLSKNILERPLSLHVDSTVPLNPWIMKDKVFSTAGSWLHISLCLKTQIFFPCFSEDRSENSKEKPRRWKKKKRDEKKHEWKDLKQWERGSEERNSVKMTIKSVILKKKILPFLRHGKQSQNTGLHALLCSQILRRESLWTQRERNTNAAQTEMLV